MKERTKGFIAGIIASTVVAGAIVGANAQEIYKNVAIAYNNIKICLDGTYIEPKDANGNKVEPFILDGTTYLPVRAVASAFGKEVDWDGNTNTVYLGAKPGNNVYSRTNPAPIGTTQTIEIDNYSTSYKAAVTVKSVLLGNDAWNMVKKANMFNSEPDEGYEYCLIYVSVTVTDVKDDAAVSLSNWDFDFYSTDYSKYSNTSVVEPDPSFGGNAYSGGTIEGYICQQIKRTDVSPTVVFGTDYYGKGGIWFSLTK